MRLKLPEDKSTHHPLLCAVFYFLLCSNAKLTCELRGAKRRRSESDSTRLLGISLFIEMNNFPILFSVSTDTHCQHVIFIKRSDRMSEIKH